MMTKTKQAAPALPPVPGGLQPVATAKRGNKVKALRLQLAAVEQEIATPLYLGSVYDPSGAMARHEAQRQADAKAERGRLTAAVARLEALDGDALVREFCEPEIEQAEMKRQAVPEHRPSWQEVAGWRPPSR